MLWFLPWPLLALFFFFRRYPTPLLVLNYDGCYDALLSSLEAMEGWELLRPGELDPLWQVCSNNADAIAATSRFFDMHA